MSGFKNQTAIDDLLAKQPLSFPDALQLLLIGKRLQRRKWKEIRFIAIQKPDEHSKMKKGYIYGCYEDSQFVPITLQTRDLLANDWLVV